MAANLPELENANVESNREARQGCIAMGASPQTYTVLRKLWGHRAASHQDKETQT